MAYLLETIDTTWLILDPKIWPTGQQMVSSVFVFYGGLILTSPGVLPPQF
jgi:hypothetical protein